MLFLCTLARARIHFFPIFFSSSKFESPRGGCIYLFVFRPPPNAFLGGIGEALGEMASSLPRSRCSLNLVFLEGFWLAGKPFSWTDLKYLPFPVRFTRRSSGNLMGGRYYAYASAKIDEKFRGNSSLASAPPPLLIFTLLLFCQKFLSIFCVFHLFIYFPRFYLTTYPSLSLLL